MLSPSNVVINTAGTVTWTNDTDESHNITPDEIFTFRGTGEIEPGESSRAVMFNGAGVKKYHCLIHPDETGTITVMETTE